MKMNWYALACAPALILTAVMINLTISAHMAIADTPERTGTQDVILTLLWVGVIVCGCATTYVGKAMMRSLRNKDN